MSGLIFLKIGNNSDVAWDLRKCYRVNQTLLVIVFSCVISRYSTTYYHLNPCHPQFEILASNTVNGIVWDSWWKSAVLPIFLFIFFIFLGICVICLTTTWNLGHSIFLLIYIHGWKWHLMVDNMFHWPTLAHPLIPHLHFFFSSYFPFIKFPYNYFVRYQTHGLKRTFPTFKSAYINFGVQNQTSEYCTIDLT